MTKSNSRRSVWQSSRGPGMASEQETSGALLVGDGMMRIVSGLVLALTGWIAIAMPLQVILAWSDAGNAVALGAAPLTSYPRFILAVILVGALVHSVIMLIVMRLAWKAIAMVREGQFLSLALASSIRSIGLLLIALAVANTVGLALAILGGAPDGNILNVDHLALHAFRLPVGVLISGLLAVMVAGAFDQARRLVRDAQLLV